MEEKVVLSLAEIEKKLEGIDGFDKKKDFLKGLYTAKDYEDKKHNISNLLAELIMNKDKPRYNIG